MIGKILRKLFGIKYMKNFTTQVFPVSQLQEQLDAMKDMKFGNRTGFGLMMNYAKPSQPAKEMVITNQEIKKLLKK